MVRHDEHAGNEQDGDHTTELDRNSLGVLPLPFPPGPESQRASSPSIEDGALPFRASAPPPSVRDAISKALAHRPAPSAQPAAPAPLPTLVFSSAPTAVVAPPLPALVPPTPAPRSEFGDAFRRAFGMPRGGAQDVTSAATPSTSSGIAALKPSAPSEPPRNAEAPKELEPPHLVRAPSARNASDAALPVEVRAAAAEARLAPSSSIQRRAIVDLLAFDPAVPNRLRRCKEHGALVAAAAGSRTHQAVDAPTTSSSAEDRARNDVLRVLSCGAPMRAEALALAFDALLDDPLELDLPLFLVEGDVTPTMDELEALRAAVEHAKPLAGSNKRMLSALGAAADALARTTPPSPETAAALHGQLEAATLDVGLPSRHLAKLVERTLREARAYKRLTLLGAPRIRATLTIGTSTLPIYLPSTVAELLPLLPTFRMSALVESRPREDAAETSPTALVAHAVGRVLRARGATREG